MTSSMLTFDCPWCGAIDPVPASQLGEHFACPECKRATKLTERNTSDRPPTEPPPDAPHRSGDRTFDCPWCGAISAVPASHLGERFHCPECGKETKLTPSNTRAAAITAPPPDAPHHDAPKERGGLVVGALTLAAIAAGVWYFNRPDTTPPPPSPQPPVADAGTPSPGTSETPAAQPEPTNPPPAPAAPDAGTGPAAPPAPAAPPSPDDAKTLARATAAQAVAAARADVERAQAADAEARAQRALWERDHPDASRSAADAEALAALAAVVDRERTTAGAAPTAAAARAASDAVVAWVSADAARVALAERVLTSMRADLLGREVLGVADWKGVHWGGDGARRAVASLHAAAVAAGRVAPEVLAAEASARGALVEARRRLGDAEARAKALEDAAAPR